MALSRIIRLNQPTSRDLHVDVNLTNMSIGYTNGAYIADQVFPILPVNKQSDKIPQYNQSFWFRDEAKLRATGTKSKGGGFTVSNTPTYYCDRYSYRFEIDDETRDNADAPWNLDRDGAMFSTDKLQMRREVAFAGGFFTTGVWAEDKVGGVDFTKWSDYGASTPLVDVSTYMDAVEARIGREANKGVMGKQVYLQLKWHPQLIDTIKYTQRGQMTLELMKALFELDALLVGRSLYTTSVEGTTESSVTYSRIWGKNMLLIYVPSAPSLMTPAAGYTFVWQRVAGALQYMKRMRDEEREVDIIEANSYFVQKATATRAGEFLSAAVA